MHAHMQTAGFSAPAALLIRGNPEFDRREDEGLLEAVGTIVVVPRGREIYAEGSSADSWFQVRSGVLRTVKLFADGRRQIDAFLLQNDFFGFEAVAEHSFGAEAISDAVVVRYSKSRIEALAAQNPSVARRLLDITLKHLSETHDHMLLLGRKTAEEKLASFLLTLLDRAPTGNKIALAMSRIDIADYLGLTIETVSRTLSAFKKDRIIDLPNPQTVIVLDHARLEWLAGNI